MIKEYNIIYLHDTETTLEGIKFYGSPRSNEFYNWAFMGSEMELSKAWAKIPEDTNVLITHGPAYGYHDLVSRPGDRDPHVGSESLTRRKEILPELKLHISGHIHEAYGTSTKGSTTNVCASILNENYQLVNSPILTTI